MTKYTNKCLLSITDNTSKKIYKYIFGLEFKACELDDYIYGSPQGSLQCRSRIQKIKWILTPEDINANETHIYFRSAQTVEHT